MYKPGFPPKSETRLINALIILSARTALSHTRPVAMYSGSQFLFRKIDVFSNPGEEVVICSQVKVAMTAEVEYDGALYPFLFGLQGLVDGHPHSMG